MSNVLNTVTPRDTFVLFQKLSSLSFENGTGQTIRIIKLNETKKRRQHSIILSSFATITNSLVIELFTFHQSQTEKSDFAALWYSL